MKREQKGPHPEVREAPKKGGFEIRIDKEAIESSEGIPEQMREWLGQLPETLSFNTPVILIVGENGSGKTQFARAVVASLSERENTDARSMSILLEDGEPSEAILPALTPTEKPQGNLIEAFIEGSEIMYWTREWAKTQARRHSEKGSGLTSGPEHRRSSRELFEDAIKDIKEVRIDRHRERVHGGDKEPRLDPKTGEQIGYFFPILGGNVVVIFDEPEQGLSPWRQLELPEQLEMFLGDGDTLLVPTNNLALLLSDMPRLSLKNPERGVYRPSEYGEESRIEFHGKE